MDYEALIGKKNITNITAAYDDLFNYNMYIFFAFDVFITIGLIQGYFHKRISGKDRKNYLFILCSILFVFYIVFGGLLLLSAFTIRCSDAGQVCSGDYLKKGDNVWKEHKDYFMMYEGKFITILFTLESVCFVVMAVSFIWMAKTSQQLELLYGQDLLRKRQTITPNFKNYKNIKYATSVWKIYRKGRELGEGQFGAVHEVQLHSTGQTYAMKILLKAKIRRDGMDDLIFSEMSVLQRAEHIRVVKLVEILEDASHFYFVMEFLQGSNLQALTSDGQFYEEKQAAGIIKQMLEGLNYLHKMGIMHRDIKLANVVKKSSDAGSLDIQLVDMGFALFKNFQQEETDFCGSPHYMAPEILLHRPYNETVDIWALGITAFKLLNGDDDTYPPYDGVVSYNDLANFARQLLKGKHYEIGPEQFRADPSAECRDFLK
jgi:tRNA A-37 threonylcarbamoyl transferase component Bud32